MNLTVNSQELAKELRLLAKIVATKPAIPILSHVLLKADDRLRLSATDLEIGLKTTCAAVINEPGVVALPVVKLLSLIEQFTNSDVLIETDKAHVILKCGAFKSRLQAMPPDDFPQLPEPEGVSNTLDATSFRQLIDRTRYAIAESGSKYLLQGALLTLAGPVAAMVATDSKRLALATMSRTGTDARVIIPVKTLDVLASGSDIDIELTVGERHLFFQSGERLLISRTIDGQFPAYERIIPRDGNKTVVVDRAALSAAIKRVGLVSEQNQAAYFDFSVGAVDISAASAEVGSADERVAISYTGDPLKVCCSWRYLLDFLDAASSQMISLAMKDDHSSLLLTDGEDHIAVIMPMRI